MRITKMRFLMFLVLLPCIASCTSTYMGRYVLWNFTSVEDYKKFPFRTVAANSNPYYFKKDETLGSAAIDTLDFKEYHQEVEGDLETFLKFTGTTAFIVIKNDTIIYEKYFNGYHRDSIYRSFSVSKSFISALVGIAIDEGYIQGVDDPVTKYVPELSGKGFDAVTIKHLLMMSSGFKFSMGIWPWNDLTILYYTPDLREYVLSHIFKENEPGEEFRYSSYNTLLLGIILERSTHRAVSQYLEEKIWKPLGMEYPALWSMNSEQDGFESCPSGLNARAIDFAKFARLYLCEGEWDGKQILSEGWVRDSTAPPGIATKNYYPRSVRREKEYYKYQWWGHPSGSGHYSYYASGQFGQLLYVDPKRKVIVVRFGKKSGYFDHGWPDIANRIATAVE